LYNTGKCGEKISPLFSKIGMTAQDFDYDQILEQLKSVYKDEPGFVNVGLDTGHTLHVYWSEKELPDGLPDDLMEEFFGIPVGHSIQEPQAWKIRQSVTRTMPYSQ